MKRTLSLIVLLAVVVGGLVTGCNKPEEAPAAPSVDTNAPATNAPAQ